MTDRPAKMLGLRDRGRLQEGYFADIVVFDPERILDTATFNEPHQFPIGFDYVLVNGKITIDHDQQTGVLAGRVLRHSS